MRSHLAFSMILALSSAAAMAGAQSVKTFPPPNAMLRDVKHKEHKSGVRIGPGNTIAIESGVGTPTEINVLSFGKGGALLAAGKDFGRVVVWDVRNHKVLCALNTKQRVIQAVAISPDGRLLATAGEGDHFSLKLWRLPDGRLLKRYKSSDGFIHRLEFGPNGTWLVVSDNSGTTRVLDLTTGKQLLTLQDTFCPVLSPDGAILVTANKTKFTVWNTSDWTGQRAFPLPSVYATLLAVNPAKDRLIVASSGGNLRLVRLDTGEALPNQPENALPQRNTAAGGFADFAADFPYVVFGHSNGRLWAWNTKTGRTCVSEAMYSESGALSPDGSVLAGAKDNSIFAQGQAPTGVFIWDTKHLVAKCGIGSRVRP